MPISNVSALSKTIYRDAGKPDTAVPVTNGCTSRAAAIPGDVTAASPIPIPTIDGALYLAAEIIWPEFWPARSNRDLWGMGPDGTYQWRNQADGCFEGGE